MKTLLITLTLAVLPLVNSGLAASPAGTQASDIEKELQAIQIPFETYRKEINPTSCMLSERRFMGCMRFIESLACVIDKHSRVYVSYEGTAADGDQKIESWGLLTWAHTSGPHSCRPHSLEGRSNFDLYIGHYKQLKANMSNHEQLGQPEQGEAIPFNAVLDSLEKKLATQPNKTLIGAAAYQQFLTWAFDPHSMLMPLTGLKAKILNFASPQSGVKSMSASLPGGLILGYLKIDNFIEKNLCLTVAAHLSRFLEQKAQALTIDLRGNTGGALAEGTCIANLFLGNKDVFGVRSVSQGVVDMSKNVQYMKSALADRLGNGVFPGPITVLMDQWSASMSEIFAGALQDHARAWIVGERSYGKGTGQVPKTFVTGMGMLETDMIFYEPSGWSHQGLGVPPDFEVSKTYGKPVEKRLPLERELFPMALEAPPATSAVIPRTLPAEYPLGWKHQRPALKAKIEACIQRRQDDFSRLNASEDFQIVYSAIILICELDK